jgi:predicted ATP-dependent protease
MNDAKFRLSPEGVRWRCDPNSLGFRTTAELTPEPGILGQDDAVDAMRYGLEARTHGTNIFVRGLSGYGRMELIHQMIQEIAPSTPSVPDLCYVCNFESPDQPRLLRFAKGSGRQFRDLMNSFAEFAAGELSGLLNSEHIKSHQKQLADKTQEEIKELGRPFDEQLKSENLTMVTMQVGQNMVPVILPVFDGKAVQFEEIQQMLSRGDLQQEDYAAIIAKIDSFESRFTELSEEIARTQEQYQLAVNKLVKGEAQRQIERRLAPVRAKWSDAPVQRFLDEVIDDLLDHRLFHTADEDFSRYYQVNLVRGQPADSPCAVISTSNPSMLSLVGKIDHIFTQNRMIALSDHLMIKPGLLLEADGGFLIIDAQDILTEPGAWSILLRVLKTGVFEIFNGDIFGMVPQIKPEPIEVDVKVILVGDPQVYYMLDSLEPRFADLFKVLADFSDSLERNNEGIETYANVIARLASRDQLPDFSAESVAALIEHGARVSAQKNRLTTKFGRIADIAREAAFITRKASRQVVSANDVKESISRSKRRAEIPARTFRRMVADKTLKIEVDGSVTGQINGLAVTSAGPMIYGFPSRITASIGIGNGGAINIESESQLSGAVHTKGFLILKGLLRQLLELDHPLAFSASLAFEQTYGGIDGDSASGAEFCCLISALTGIPLRQDLAMTGAIDQRGYILPIGAATEKIEGFFDACQTLDYTGTQGVIIPASNAPELMLREDIVAAVSADTFSVFAISHITDAITLLTGIDAGEKVDGIYAPDSVLGIARQRARQFWDTSQKSHKPS